MPMDFIHSGATGDIIYSLPIMKDMGGGTLYIKNFNQQRSEAIKPLIEAQSYVDKVVITNGFEDGIILDQFRQYADNNVNLVDAHYLGQNKDKVSWWKNGWLELPEKENTISEKYCVINRTTNYADLKFNWAKEVDYLKNYADRILFLGYDSEYQLFKNLYNRDVEFYKTNDFLEVAYLLKYAEMRSVCYSCINSITKGLNLKHRLEQAPGHTNSTFYIENETIINL